MTVIKSFGEAVLNLILDFMEWSDEIYNKHPGFFVICCWVFVFLCIVLVNLLSAWSAQ